MIVDWLTLMLGLGVGMMREVLHVKDFGISCRQSPRILRFEGLTRDAVPHGMGVMTFGNGTGGGFHFRDVRRADKWVRGGCTSMTSVGQTSGSI